MSIPATRLHELAEYLASEEASETRHEFYRGRVYAMAGASPDHVSIATYLAAALVSRLRGSDCRVFSTDLRVRTGPDGLYCYPDVGVVCCEPVYADDAPSTLTNPRVLIEVLSNSTAAYDSTTKYAFYTAIPSLAEYLLVAQDRAVVKQHVRQADGSWKVAVYVGLGAGVEFTSLGVTVPMSEIYEAVTLPTDYPQPAGDAG